MNKICEENKCTGCGLCVNVCPVNAISLDLNNEGFYMPKINNNSCIKCLLCEKKCKEQNEKKYPITAFKAKSKNKEVLINSTSGGIFSELSKHIIKDGGVVFGAECACVFTLWVKVTFLRTADGAHTYDR